ncbi:MAG: DUF1554 domain-containing protein [Deltaproteobacteria bacterium]|nr:DUF1554 domain-containing protein [Deltaproteobacteria bacterium]
MTRQLLGSGLAGVALLVLACPSGGDDDTSACNSTHDCDSNRICDNGQCVAPVQGDGGVAGSSGGAASSASAPASGSSAGSGTSHAAGNSSRGSSSSARASTSVPANTTGTVVTTEYAPEQLREGGVVILRLHLGATPSRTVSCPIDWTGAAAQARALPSSFSGDADTLSVLVEAPQDREAETPDVLLAQVGACTSLDARFMGVDPPDLAIPFLDDDLAGLAFTPDPVHLLEGDRVVVGVYVTSQPAVDLELSATVEDAAGRLQAAPALLAIPRLFWTLPAELTLQVPPDAVATPRRDMLVRVRVSTVGAGPYQDLEAVLPVRQQPDTVVVSAPVVVAREGAPAIDVPVTFSPAPASPVTVSVSSSSARLAVKGPGGLVSFTLEAGPGGPVLLNLTVSDDSLFQADEAATVTLTFDTVDPVYQGLGAHALPVTLANNDLWTYLTGAAVMPGGGVAAFDATCRSDVRRPSVYPEPTWAALVGSAQRTPGSPHWVLQPYSTYHEQPGGPGTSRAVFSTDAQARVVFPVQSYQSAYENTWTGLAGDTTPITTDNCDNWTNSTTSSGRNGRSNVTYQAFLDYNNTACGSSRSLMCVQVP